MGKHGKPPLKVSQIRKQKNNLVEKKKKKKKMVDPENLNDHKYLNELKMKYENIEEELEKLYEKWEEII